MTINSLSFRNISNKSISSKATYRAGKTITSTATISSTQSKFNDTSGYYNGSSGYTSITSGLSDFGFGTGDFTIEGWWYFNANTTAYLYDFRSTSTQPVPCLLYETTGTKLSYYVNSGYRIQYTWTPTLSTWYHIAVSRTGTSTKMFVDGTQVGSTYSDSNSYIVPGVAIIGRYGQGTSSYISAYIDDFRISKGIARYTTAFTPPTAAFLNDSYTILLLNYNGANGSTAVLDERY